MYKQHKQFKIEKTKNIPLWRYMDFWKFLNLLSTSKLFFPNIEMLGDQHEGKIPNKIYQMMVEKDKIQEKERNKNYKYLIEEKLRKTTLVCSWIASHNESFAMWKMYAKEKLGIAIKTKFDNLKNCFNKSNENIYIGEVFYYDDSNPYYEIGNTFFTFLTKHNYYQFESEVRCITEITDQNSTFKNIDVDLNTLIQEVYISPFAYETGLVEIIEFLKSKYSLNFNIKISGVNDKWI